MENHAFCNAKEDLDQGSSDLAASSDATGAGYRPSDHHQHVMNEHQQLSDARQNVQGSGNDGAMTEPGWSDCLGDDYCADVEVGEVADCLQEEENFPGTGSEMRLHRDDLQFHVVDQQDDEDELIWRPLQTDFDVAEDRPSQLSGNRREEEEVGFGRADFFFSALVSSQVPI